MSATSIQFSWAQFSDVHFGQGSSATTHDRRLLLAALTDDLKRLQDSGVPRPMAVLITGDSAFSGNNRVPTGRAESTEYLDASAWLAGVAEALEVPLERVYLVPGNHDVDRKAYADNRHLKRLLDRLRSGEEDVDGALEDESDRSLLESRFSAYLSFTERFAVRGRRKLFWTDDLDVGNGTVRLVGLNTALLSQDKDDDGHLAFGKKQLADAFADLGASPDLTVSFAHHPFSFLRDGKDAFQWVRARGDIHISGHTHEHGSDVVASGAGATCVILSSGALHGLDNNDRHGFALGIAEKSQGALRVRVWPRVWAKTQSRFTIDGEGVLEGSAFAEHITGDGAAFPEPPAPEDATAACGPALGDDAEVPTDAPLIVETWVGRTNEINALNTSSSARVVAITGMGGQGKSALAGHHLEANRVTYRLWDWRDCREEADTLHTQLVAIIQRVTRTRSRDLAGEQVDSLVRTLFASIGQQQHLFVFDNIDQYVDIEECKPIGGMRMLMDAALRVNHRSRFIFTCRPPLVYEDPSFLHLPLRGFSEAETISLFEKRDVSTASPETHLLVTEAHELTRGHPMWLNLIATQVSKNRANLDQLVSEMRRGVAGDLPVHVLRRIWKSLPPKEVYILRCLGEAIRPLTEERLEEMVAAEVTRVQLERHLRALRLLDLVVTKTGDSGPPTIELHPLIKRFVTTEYPRTERGTVINVLIIYYDKLIAKFKGRLDADAPYTVLEYWILKAELACNCGRYLEAATALREIGSKVCDRGFPEEFLRVALRLFSAIDWPQTFEGPISDFDWVLRAASVALSQLGRRKESETLLDRYEAAITGKSARYINLCEMRCYMLWCAEDFERAKEWGERGVELQKTSDIDTKFDPSHNLALARRDLGEVEPALRFFLKGRELADVVARNIPEVDEDGPYYGNIGRCLQFMHRPHEALLCLHKSGRILESDGSALVNRGHAALWIAETLEVLGKPDLAFCFYSRAIARWRAVSPPRMQTALTRRNRVRRSLTRKVRVALLEEWQTEAICREWLAKDQ